MAAAVGTRQEVRKERRSCKARPGRASEAVVKHRVRILGVTRSLGVGRKLVSKGRQLIVNVKDLYLGRFFWLL